jgi:ribonuclease D
MQTHLHKNDLPENISFGDIIAIDTEAMGLDPARDRLCLIQMYDGGRLSLSSI